LDAKFLNNAASVGPVGNCWEYGTALGVLEIQRTALTGGACGVSWLVGSIVSERRLRRREAQLSCEQSAYGGAGSATEDIRGRSKIGKGSSSREARGVSTGVTNLFVVMGASVYFRQSLRR
jgi:hypothetical protein